MEEEGVRAKRGGDEGRGKWLCMYVRTYICIDRKIIYVWRREYRREEQGVRMQITEEGGGRSKSTYVCMLLSCADEGDR